jgi:hypothetical protein
VTINRAHSFLNLQDDAAECMLASWAVLNLTLLTLTLTPTLTLTLTPTITLTLPLLLPYPTHSLAPQL